MSPRSAGSWPITGREALLNVEEYAHWRLQDLIESAGRLSREHFGRRIAFAAPSQKYYDIGLYRSQRRKFLTLSVTGEACALGCEHCGAKVLQGMAPAKSPARLRAMLPQLVGGGAEGVLISGGCLEDGSVPLDRFLEEIAELKRRGLTVLVHTGLVHREVARGLKKAGVDQVLLDIIGSDETIHQVYHLRRSKAAYREALRILREEGLPAVPHIVVGLHFGQIVGEYEALRMIQEEGAARLVVVVLEPLPGTGMAGVMPPSAEEVARILATARMVLPHIPIALGCAKPAGPSKREMERLAVDIGVQSIAYPLAETVRYAQAQAFTIDFHERCCSLS